MTAHPDDARGWSGWVPGWVPTATPPTVPWQRPAPGPAPAPSPVGVGGTVRELVADVGRWAVSAAATGIEDGLAALAAHRDPARRHARQLRRARRRLGAEAAVAGGLGVLAATAGIAPGWSAAEIAFGGGAAVVGLAAAGSARRLRDLRRHPPRPRHYSRPARPPRDCPARRPLDRLDERERALVGLLTHLGAAGAEPREVAADAAATLRELGARTTAVDRARRGAPPDAVAGLDAAVAALVGRLDAGVAAYDALVVAAADAVAADATLHAGDPVLLLRLTEATDSLAGLAHGLREVAG